MERHVELALVSSYLFGLHADPGCVDRALPLPFCGCDYAWLPTGFDQQFLPMRGVSSSFSWFCRHLQIHLPPEELEETYGTPNYFGYFLSSKSNTYRLFEIIYTIQATLGRTSCILGIETELQP